MSTGQPTQLLSSSSHHHDEEGHDEDEEDDDFAVTSGEATSAPLPEKVAELKASASLLRSAVAFRLQGVMMLVSGGGGGGGASRKRTKILN